MKELIKQDINFCEHPLWFQDSKEQSIGLVWDDPKGFKIRVGYKIPTKTDIIFLYYLMLRSQQEGWKEKLTLTQREILRGCGISPGKDHAERLKDSLNRWKMMGLEFSGTFYDGKEYQAMSFGIIDEWDLEKGTGHLNIRFAPKWLEQIKNSNYFRYLDFQQMKSIGSPLAIRLYEILNKSFQGRNEWSIDALKLATKIPMKQKYAADISPRITAATDIINAKTSLNLTLTVKRPRRGQAIFVFKKLKSSKPTKPLQTGRCNAETTGAQADSYKTLTALLPAQHRQKKTIREVIIKALSEHDFEYVKRNILYTSETAGKNYRAYLTKSIMDDWGEGWQEDKDQENESKHQQKVKEQEERNKAKEEKRIHLAVTKRLQIMPPEELTLHKEMAHAELTESEKQLDEVILSACINARIRASMARELRGREVKNDGRLYGKDSRYSESLN